MDKGIYDEAENCYRSILRFDENNFTALNNLSILYSEHTYYFRKALELSLARLKLANSFINKTTVAEDLIKVKDYSQGRKYALEAFSASTGTIYAVINKFFILCSYMLENNRNDANKQLKEFVMYYKGLNSVLKIRERRYSFKGIARAIDNSAPDFRTQFILRTALDIIQGKIDTNELSIIGATE